MKNFIPLLSISLLIAACSDSPTSNEDSLNQDSSSSNLSSEEVSSGKNSSSQKGSAISHGSEASVSSSSTKGSSQQTSVSSEANASSAKNLSSSSDDPAISSSSSESLDVVAQTQKATVGRFGTFTDSRDGKTYHWTEIGAQVWMADNIDFEASADPGPCYERNPLGCAFFGRMYDFTQAQTACPTDWHLPSDVEYRILAKAAGIPQTWFDSDSASVTFNYGNTYAARFFSKNPILYTGLGTDEYNFRLLAAGYGETYGYPWVFFNSSTELWTSSVLNTTTSVAWGFENSAGDYPTVRRKAKTKSTYGYVRCLYNGKASSLTQTPVPTTDPLFVQKALPTTTAACERTPAADEFCDTRDGHVYAKKTIGANVWMVQNLKYSANGTLGVCPGGTAAGREQYGRLYPSHEAWNRPEGCNYTVCETIFPIDKGICPSGWRLPTDDDAIKDIVPIDTTLLASDSLKNQFAGTISKNQGYEGALEQEYLGQKLNFWLKPSTENDWEAPVLETYNANSVAADINNTRKYFSASVRCVQE